MTSGESGSITAYEDPQTPNGGGPPNPQSSILRDTIPTLKRSHRPFVVIVGLLMTTMAVTPLAIGDPAARLWLSLAYLGVVALIVVLLFVVARERPAGPHAGYERRQQAGDAVTGTWWQIILRSVPGAGVEMSALTLMRVNVSVGEGVYQIMGQLFDGEGDEKSWWSAEAVALENTTPVELFYKWRGQSFRETSGYEPRGALTGIGNFRFYRHAKELEPCTEGDGWYSSGDVEKLEFGIRREMRLQRLTAAENRKLERSRNASKKKLVKNAYVRFSETYCSSPRAITSLD